jgi:RNA polymerase sigma-32 factor
MARVYRDTGSSVLERYLADIERFPVLAPDEEQRLARSAGPDAARIHRLVRANLRFVVKIAYEYRSYGFKISDLVQEGNIGLLKAVQRFDPDRGIRLISYAVWWIRAQIQAYILKSWSLVKIGTTQAQRKLFFSLARTRRELELANMARGGPVASDVSRIARRLEVTVREVDEMSQRMEARDLSLDAPIGEAGEETFVDLLAGGGLGQEHELGEAQEHTALEERVSAALTQLDERERYVIEHRIMSDQAKSLQELGAHFGISRERARQLELRARRKLRQCLHELAVELQLAPPQLPRALRRRGRGSVQPPQDARAA